MGGQQLRTAEPPNYSSNVRYVQRWTCWDVSKFPDTAHVKSLSLRLICVL